MSILDMRMDADEIKEQLKRPKRKPNFTPPERMHLARVYVDNVDEYNRGFTASTRGDAKHGRQRLLEKWATELTAFGVAERTTVEVEQKLRDYMKKIMGNNRRPTKRPLSPAAELLSSIIPQCSAAYMEDGSVAISKSDPQTEYVDFLLRQHRTDSDEPMENNWNSHHISENNPSSCCGESSTTVPTPLDLSLHLDDTARLQRALLAQQLENARTDHAIKLVLLETARIDQKIKLAELEKKKLELEKLQQHRPNVGSPLPQQMSNQLNNNIKGSANNNMFSHVLKSEAVG
ncbi:hypothetical protein AB6A40_002901 [Gnathostoma spinigerum]|uniref:Uncharacterized protein n=1 Tax=Gnathostoma spinigerum TaxID=75299 RepID=A0ABD6EHZ4_9BILA